MTEKELKKVKLRKVSIDQKIKKQLLERAAKAAENAFHPITSAGTGAALFTEKGNIYEGCNFQSTISGLGTCAERAAIYHAATHGEYRYIAIAVVFPSKQIQGPCGACCQLIAEAAQIAQNDIIILMANAEGKYKETTINKLLPDAYGPRKAGKDLTKWESK